MNALSTRKIVAIQVSSEVNMSIHILVYLAGCLTPLIAAVVFLKYASWVVERNVIR